MTPNIKEQKSNPERECLIIKIRAMKNEKSFAKELAELINRHSIDAKFETADDILATVAIDALNTYYKAKVLQERRNNPENDNCDCPACQLRRAMEAKKEYKKPQAFDVPKEVAGIADLVAKLFPGAKIEIQCIDVPRNNPRNKRRNRNKSNGGRNNG